MQNDQPLCVCANVSKAEILEYFSSTTGTVEAFMEETGLGAKCTACLLDFDMVLSEIQQTRISAPTISTISGVTGKLRMAVDRVDSGFFVNNAGVATFLRISNFGPLFQHSEDVVEHDYRLTLFGRDGRRGARVSGKIGIDTSTQVNLLDIDRCPSEGWFLLELRARGDGLYGSIRPQVGFLGRDWAATYHTQPHMHASRSDQRRTAITLKVVGGKTCARVAVINAVNRRTDVRFRLGGAMGEQEMPTFELPPRGFHIFDLDEIFHDIANEEIATLKVYSKYPTRKFIVNQHDDGSWGVDHFPDTA